MLYLLNATDEQVHMYVREKHICMFNIYERFQKLKWFAQKYV